VYGERKVSLNSFCMAAWATSTLGSQFPLQTARAGDTSTSAKLISAAARETARITRLDVTDPTGTTAT
jgi:hypothetical protein